jgi:hypothetical protein
LSRQGRQKIVGEPAPRKLGLGDVPNVGLFGANFLKKY